MIEKRVTDSATEQVHIVMFSHINGNKRLFGGTLMEWIDVVAGVVARRHAGTEVTTLSVDNLQFKKPAFLNDTIFLYGRITYVGNTSMEVRVDTYVEDMSSARKLINTAYFVMVALDADNQPTAAPKLRLETEVERAEWEAAQKRNMLRKQRRLEDF